MSSDLESAHIFILYKLTRDHCFSSKRGFHSEKLEKLYKYKYHSDPKFKNVIKDLVNRGLITEIGKSPPKYYISDMKEAFYVLSEHGENLPGDLSGLSSR